MKRIYLDYAASTPIDRKVSLIMKKAEALAWGNASSLHQEGEMAKKILDEARSSIATILRCRAEEVYFTSGGTEAANLAIFGIIKGLASEQLSLGNPHIICSSIEHPSVLESVKATGAELTIITPDKNGLINPQSIAREIKENTVMVCIMYSNNEIGTIQPIHKISTIVKEWRNKNNKSYPYLVCDASQSTLYEDVSPERLGVDALILDGIKMYGPRGKGILILRHSVLVHQVVFGGGQERGLRSGTEDAVGALSLAEALKIAVSKRESESSRLKKLRDYCINEILNEIPNSSLNGDPKFRLPNNVNICFEGEDSEFLVIKLDTLGFAVSAASACNNLNLENSSYVIESLGKKGCGRSSLRFTFGRDTTKGDIDKLISTLKKILKK